MSDTIDGPTNDGSPSAPQNAQTGQSKGFFKRLFASSRTAVKPDENKLKSAMPAGGIKILSDLRVDDVAVPRADISAVANDLKLDEIAKVFKDSGYSRLPVFNENLDKPEGLIHLKDLTLKYGFSDKPKRFNLKPLLRPLLYVPPSMKIGVLLQKMQAERIHMALVIDEYGGVDGLVTIEDLIEQVVGEIEDEHDAEEDNFWVEETTGVYLVQARAPLEDFEKVLDADLASNTDDEDIDTLGGLVFMMIGRVPVRGEVIKHPHGFEFEVVDADPRRIKKLRVRRSKTS